MFVLIDDNKIYNINKNLIEGYYENLIWINNNGCKRNILKHPKVKITEYTVILFDIMKNNFTFDNLGNLLRVGSHTFEKIDDNYYLTDRNFLSITTGDYIIYYFDQNLGEFRQLYKNELYFKKTKYEIFNYGNRKIIINKTNNKIKREIIEDTIFPIISPKKLGFSFEKIKLKIN